MTPRRDGRVVDGGGLENLPSVSSRGAIFHVKSAKYGRYWSATDTRPVMS